MTAPSRSLIIPMKDEATRLGDSLRTLRAARFDPADTELVLVDDGSTDGTAELAESLLAELGLGGRVVRLPHNVGKGGAIAAGVADARGEVLAFVDADLSTPPSAIEAAFELVEAGKADVVVSTRVHPEANITAAPSLGRRYGGRAFNLLIRGLGLTTLSDTQCGLKAFTAEAGRAVFADLRCPRFAFDVEVLARAEHAGLTVLELPVEWAHGEESHVHALRDGSRMVADVLRLRWSWRRGVPEAGVPEDVHAPSQLDAVGPTGVTDDDHFAVMDDDRFAVMAELERDHWWFAAKRRLVTRAIGRHVGRGDGARAADIGCGTGAMVDDLAASGFAAVIGTDASSTAIGFAHRATESSESVAGHLVTVAEALPFRAESLRCLTSLDVVEHLDDDVVALREYLRVVEPGGVVVLTVPAYRWAWSDHDVALGHRRRYSRDELRAAVEAAGFVVERATYFHSWLVLPALLVRRTPLGRLMGGSSPEEASFGSPSLNRLLGVVSRTEAAVLRRADLPFGLSILLVARR